MTMKNKPLGTHFARRINMRPMAIEPGYLPAVEGLIEKADDYASLSKERRIEMYEDTKQQMLAAYGLINDGGISAYSDNNSRSSKPFAFGNGTAVIPIHGTLVNRCNDTACGTMTGYNMIQNSLAAAVNDDDVERILFDVDSGGGEVSGCKETAEMIRKAGEVKPTMAFVDAYCYSAAYWLASSANQLVALGSGGVGSIGAIMVHTEYSQALSDEGIKVTVIRAGKEKATGLPYEPLSKETRDQFQASVDKARESFAETVAANRGLDIATVMGTEAACYSAEEGLEMGLVDALSDPMHALSLFEKAPRNSDNSDKGSAKAAENGASDPAPLNDETTGEDMTEQEKQALRLEAAQEERTRIAAIVNSEAAEGREALANHFALKTAMAPEDAIAALEVSPKAVAEKKKEEVVDEQPKQEEQTPATAEAAFNAAMQGTGNPNIGAGDPAGTGADNQATDDASAIIAAYQAATGVNLSNQ